jgi:16S rRNA (cytidine1402-2'-O)-methyltransferase
MAGPGTPLGGQGERPEPNEAVPSRKLAPGLWVVATPIGHLGDLSPRAAAALAEADLVVCEDTRTTAKLMAHIGARRPMAVYNDHSAPRVRPQLLERLRGGQALALVSDAGTPCLSDPGYKLVRAALAEGVAVRAVPGPSAVTAALSIAGLPTDRFLFLGFLPPRSSARRATLGEIASVRATLVVLEAPTRLAAALADAAAVLGAREAVVARELTKIFEEVRHGRLDALAAAYASAPTPKGELVVLIGPPETPLEPAAAEIDGRLQEALATLPPRRAAAEVARATGVAVNRLYARAVALKRGDD